MTDMNNQNDYNTDTDTDTENEHISEELRQSLPDSDPGSDPPRERTQRQPQPEPEPESEPQRRAQAHVDPMVSEELRQALDDAEVEGWSVANITSDSRAVVKKHDYGSLGGHVLIALLSIWWTFGLGNVLYAAYRYFFKADKRVIRVGE